MKYDIINTGDYLLIVDETEINQDDYIYRLSNKELEKANDEWLDDTHDDWKKIIAHLPLNNSPILEGVDLLPTFEDEFEYISNEYYKVTDVEELNGELLAVYKAIKKTKEKYKYTEEDIKEAMNKIIGYAILFPDRIIWDKDIALIIQSLQQPKIPVEFKCNMVDFEVDMGLEEECIEYNQYPKTTTNSQGLTQWVGEYIY